MRVRICHGQKPHKGFTAVPRVTVPTGKVYRIPTRSTPVFASVSLRVSSANTKEVKADRGELGEADIGCQQCL
jgi:hypothetical protein